MNNAHFINSNPPSFSESGTNTEIVPVQQEISLIEYWTIVRRRWIWILLTTLLFSAGGFFYTSSLTRLYKASGVIAITPPQSQRIGEIEVTRDIMGRESFLQTQQTILKSRTIAKKVIEKIPDPVCLEFFGKKREEVSETQFLVCMELEQQKNSDVLIVGFVGKSARHCATLANLLIDVFIEESDRQNIQHSMLINWLKNEIPQIEKRMIRNRETLMQFESENMDILLASRGQGGFYSAILEQARQELQGVKVRSLDAEARYRKCQEARAKGTLEAVMALDFFEENPLFQKLRQQQMEMENSLADAQLKYTAEHPRVLWINAQLRKIDQKLWQEAEIFLVRQEESCKDLRRRQETLGKMVQEEFSQSIQLKQKFLEYERHQREHETLQKAYNSLIDKMKELDITASYRMGNIRKIDPAEPPSLPYKPNKTRNYLLSFLLGIMAGIGLVFLVEQMDEKARSINEIRQIIAAPLLGYVPLIPQQEFPEGVATAVRQNNRSNVAESFRNISTSLFLMNKGSGRNTFMISSTMASDGKTTVLCNLALTIAQAGYKVLLIDGDLRKPRLHHELSLTSKVGLSDFLQGNATDEEIVCPVSENLFCISSGKTLSDPYSLFIPDDFEHFLQKMASRYDYVLLDSPPLGVAAETLLFIRTFRNLILVVGSHHAYKNILKEMVHQMNILSFGIHGFVINDVDNAYTLARGPYYYKYYSRYYSTGKEKREKIER